MTLCAGATAAGEPDPSGAAGGPGSEARLQAARSLHRKLRGVKQVFTDPPAAIGDVSAILPLGNINGVSHIIPVDHMYLRYPHGPNGGIDTVMLHAMAAGELVMVARRDEQEFPVLDYSIWIRHTPAVTSQYEHVHQLSARLEAYLESTGEGWILIDPSFEIMFLGQLGAPAPLALAAGEVVGSTRSFTEYWDLGVTDTDTHGVFANRQFTRYPTIMDYVPLLGLPLEQPPYAGQETLNAGCFVRYLAPDLRDTWSALLPNPPGDCGRVDWDLDGFLRGTWFNPVLDTTQPPPLFDLEWGAFSITPFNVAPATQLQIAIPTGHPLAAIDPTGAHPQLRRRFLVDIDTSPGTRINPDPATVGPQTGAVCYDLRYPSGSGERFNALLLLMTSPLELAIAYDPTPATTSRCATLLAAGTTSWTTTYVR